jgi:hypothetical protein
MRMGRHNDRRPSSIVAAELLRQLEGSDDHHLGETGPLSQGVQAGRKAIRIHHMNCMEVRKKRPRGFK